MNAARVLECEETLLKEYHFQVKCKVPGMHFLLSMATISLITLWCHDWHDKAIRDEGSLNLKKEGWRDNIRLAD